MIEAAPLTGSPSWMVAQGETHIVWEATGTYAEAYNFKN